ncbi:DNA repair protein Rad4 family [Artemisia annua]|uniref:DNA repair protein Rad4 family n=1 Tax=Artemisia annua TaxID=35608 RepID=A0A2U1KRL8_ARTAN|nr:DNA repair protein Rad4 family [Artemisia annua]
MYLLEWLKLKIVPKNYILWLHDHLHAYFAVGAQLQSFTPSIYAANEGLCGAALPKNETSSEGGETIYKTQQMQKNGIVPKNERGQVDVWSEKCLPSGTVHLGFQRVWSITKKLKIDYAPSMVYAEEEVRRERG